MGRSCIERDFCRRWLIQLSCSSMWTPMSLAMAITTSLVFSSAVSGTPWRRTFSRRLYWTSRSSSNGCDCKAERGSPTSFVKRSFSAAMLESGGQHSFDGGRDCCLDGPLKQRFHLSHDCLHDVVDSNAGCRDVGRICSDCPLRRTPRRSHSLPCLSWLPQVRLSHNLCLSSETRRDRLGDRLAQRRLCHFPKDTSVKSEQTFGRMSDNNRKSGKHEYSVQISRFHSSHCSSVYTIMNWDIVRVSMTLFDMSTN